MKDGSENVVQNPSNLPDQLYRIEEPIVSAEIIEHRTASELS